LHLWELATGKARKQIRFDSAEVGDWSQSSDGVRLGRPPLRFSPDQKTFSITTAGSVSQYSIATGKELRRFSRDGLISFGAAFSADGRLLAAPDQYGKIFVWETASATVLASFDGGATHATLVAFSPDGKRLASAHIDGVVLVWNLEHFLKKDVRNRMESEQAWLALADAAAVAVFKKRLHPPVLPDARRFERLLSDLGSPRFATRQQATRESEMLHELAEPGFRKALALANDVETRRRLEGLLENLTQREPSPSLLQALRAVEVLEQIGTPEARELLQNYVKGLSGYRATEAAAQALERLAER
jgi:hypothetical protein